MTGLRLLHGIFHIGIENLGIAAISLQIARGLQTPPQLYNGGMAHARAQFNGRQLWPAAPDDNLGVFFDRVLRRSDVFPCESWKTTLRLRLPLAGELPVAKRLLPGIV